jgi:hypothetical protein
MIAASVTTVTANRVVQLMPRLTHQSMAQPITTGTMVSGRNARLPWIGSLAAQREPTLPPTPMLTVPPIFTQVSVPSTFAKPGPYAAQGLPARAPFTGSSLPELTVWPGC